MVILLVLIIILLLLLAYTFWLTIQRLQRSVDRQTLSCPPPVACPPATVCPPCAELPTKVVIDNVTQRDRAANSDPLYPPLNRMPMPVVPQSGEDTFRFLGYMINKIDKEDTWKLFGREKNRNQAEFYAMPTDRTSDIKVMVTQEIVVSKERLRDIYTIPEEITLKHPLFAPTPYQIVLNPNSDLSSSRIYY